MCACVCACMCTHTYIYTRVPQGIKGQFHTRPRNAVEQKAGAGTTDLQLQWIRRPLFALRINLGLLQRPQLGLH